MSTLSIGVTGLNAASIGLATTSNNIANASTAGYNRQTIVQATNFSTLTGAGFVGQGTHVETVKRVYSEFLAGQVLSAQTQAAQMDSYLGQISRIDNLLSDTTSGLSSSMSSFFSGIQSVTNDPSSVSARQSMLSSAQTLVTTFQSLNQQLAEIRRGVSAQITSVASEISNYAQEIAQVNQRILYAQAGSQGQPANDLLDQRDQLVAELNQLVKVDTVVQSNGMLTVSIGNGQPLVVGTQASSITAVAASDDPETMVLKVTIAGGATISVPDSQITGGSLGGLISFRNETLDSTQNALGRIAIALAQTFNDQHALGQDLNGNLGGDFFSVADPTVYASSANTGNAVLAATFSATAASNLTTSDYQLSLIGTTYTLTRLSDGETWSGGSLTTMVNADGDLADEGFDLSLAGSMNSGDIFKIEPTRTGASSLAVVIRNTSAIAAAAPMATSAATGNTGTGGISPGSVDGPAPPNSAIQDTVTITFTSATTYDVVDTTTGVTLAGAQTYAAGGDISYNGWTVQISGSPVAGDVFTVQANTNGVSDNRNAVALAGLATTDTMVGKSASYLDAYAQLVSEVGNKTREVKAIGASQTALAESAIATQQELSGVNLDEEAANLIRYQQAYQASAKVIEIASKVFDSILALG